MSQMDLPAEGGCRCGRVRIRISAPPLLSMACHCTGCQRMSSSAFSLSVAIPGSGFEVVQGEPVIGGLHGEEAHHYFCGWCMSWMFARPQVPGVDFVNLRPTMLDDAKWFSPSPRPTPAKSCPGPPRPPFIVSSSSRTSRPRAP